MAKARPKVAFFDFACCEGCQLTVIDSLQTHLDLLDAVEVVNWREVSSRQDQDYQIAFVEGSITRPEDEERILGIREQAAVLVGLGACSHMSCVNALKGLHPLEDVRRWVYGDKADWYDTYEVRPVGDVVELDAFVPGCPIDREEFVRIVKALLLGKKPSIPDYPVCVECKLKDNVCVYFLDQPRPCLGPITRAGCDAICPTYGDGCEGCRGLIPNPNENAMKDVLAEAGLTVEEITSRITMFNAGHSSDLEVRHGED
ncbi:MAG: NADH:ubiquinone oxidoreductase [Anaerolineales bacterium]|nr:MAG: NADH:ubiquinone oxidoreductase [Anaerolineales bacterium]